MTDAAPGNSPDYALPDGWRWTTIGDHYEFKNGLNKPKRFFGRGTPIINYMDVFRHQRLCAAHVHGKVTVSNDEADAYSALKGDAFFTRTSETVSEIGYSAVLLEPIHRAVFSGFVLRGRPKTKDLVPEFAAYALRAREVRRQIEARATCTTRALTNGGSLSECVFPLPKEPEQQAIAQALIDIDNLISSLEALIAKKRDIQQGAMQQLLSGKRRLPGFSGDWTGVPFGEFGDCYGGLTGKTKGDFGRGDGRYVTFTNVMSDVSVDIHKVENVQIGLGEKQNSVKKGDLILNGSSETPDELAIASAVEIDPPERLYMNSFCIGFRPHSLSGFMALFWAYYLRGGTSRRMFANVAQGSTRYNLSKRHLRAMVVPNVGFDEQKAIADVLQSMSDEIRVLQKRRNKIADVRDGMKQQLLTGRIRLV